MLHGAYAWPSFASGAILSARQINTLAAIADDVRSRGMAASIGYKVPVTQSSVPVGGFLFHKHDADLYYNIAVSDSEGGGGAASAYLYYKNLTTPLVTIPAANGMYRALVDLSDKPTAGTHPADGERLYVRVTPAAGWAVTVYRCEEIVLPTGYTTMDDATALTNDATAASVPTDLQLVSDNLAALSAITTPALPGFRPHVQVEGDPLIGLAGQANPATYRIISNLGDTLYYKIGIFKDGRRDGQSVVVTIASNATTLATLTETGDYDYTGPHIYEGSVSLSGVARVMNQGIPITISTAWNANGADGSGGCYVMYLREGE